MNLITRSAPFAVALLLGMAPMAQAKTVMLTGKFAAEGAATTMPTGHFVGKFNTVTDRVTYHIFYTGLSGPVTAAHFHGPADPGVSAGVMLPIPGPYVSGMHGVLKADSATEAALLAGKTYVNLHTDKYPMGEARAQVEVTK